VEAKRVSLFRMGRDQAVRIPREFELPGTEALIRHENGWLIVEPARPTACSPFSTGSSRSTRTGLRSTTRFPSPSNCDPASTSLGFGDRWHRVVQVETAGEHYLITMFLDRKAGGRR